MEILFLVCLTTEKPTPSSALTKSFLFLNSPLPAIDNNPSVIALAASCFGLGKFRGVVSSRLLMGSSGAWSFKMAFVAIFHALIRGL
ncbi:hypothetical protein P3571_23190, partial [Vibrio parahaemolyticus]|nr:hypothetical protein [Vibrio parahaemolyticus]